MGCSARPPTPGSVWSWTTAWCGAIASPRTATPSGSSGHQGVRTAWSRRSAAPPPGLASPTPGLARAGTTPRSCRAPCAPPAPASGRRRAAAGARIRVSAVVVDAKLGQPRQEANQVEPAAVVAGADLRGRDVVPAPGDPGLHPLQVELGRAETDVPDPYLDADGQGAFEQSRDRLAAERRLEGEGQSLGDCAFQQALAFLPRRAVRVGLAGAGVTGADQPRGLIRVEVLRAGLPEHSPGQATLAGAIGP